MKKLFYFSLFVLILFEILNVYFIMPFPGSQRIESIDIAYFLHSWRWQIRVVLWLLVLSGLPAAFRQKRKWMPALIIITGILISYFFNFKMTADHMFLEPVNLELKTRLGNTIPEDRLVLGIENNGEARAYPIEFLTYHHQIRDNIGGKQVMITYCSVCRTGRVFEPIVNGQAEKFRLVGMDHFNAMFEDSRTKSWWRQVTGEAIAGKLKGTTLPEMEARQMTIKKWYEMYPHGLVMQPDPHFDMEYDTLAKFEKGLNVGKLTRTDSLSWQEKSWVLGLTMDGISKAYDWNDLVNAKTINDTIDYVPVFIALSDDGQSFAAFKKPANVPFSILRDTIISPHGAYNFAGESLSDSIADLVSIKAYQEFWHSWFTFHPETRKYSDSDSDSDSE